MKAGHARAATRLGPRLHAFAMRDLGVLAAALADTAAPHRGIHEARKAIRRLRALLQLGHRRFGRRGTAVDDALARLADGLSDLRDAQVVLELAGRHLREAPDEDERRRRAALRRRLSAERRTALAGARALDPDFAERRAEVARIGRVVDGLPWPLLDARDLERALMRSQRRVERAGEHAERAGASAERRHRWRRRLRRLRMQWNTLKALAKSGLDGDDLREVRALLTGLRRRTGSFRELGRSVDALGAEQDRRLLQAILARMAALAATVQTAAAAP